MREQQKDSVQSRFTAYLVVAVANRRKRYLDKKHRTMEREVVHEELLELGYVNFDLQYHTYVIQVASCRNPEDGGQSISDIRQYEDGLP